MQSLTQISMKRPNPTKMVSTPIIVEFASTLKEEEKKTLNTYV